jgi:hypothetical protein
MKKSNTFGPGLWAYVTDYLLGRNTLIGIASMTLLIISGCDKPPSRRRTRPKSPSARFRS